MMNAVEEVVGRKVSRETAVKLSDYAEMLLAESDRQNLIARSTIPDLWKRHLADSAQLVPIAGTGRSWADIGSGAGMPGMVVAILSDNLVTLIEPRRLRAEFLENVATRLRLKNVRVVAAKAEAVSGQFDVISARAVAPAVDLLRISRHLAHTGTRYLLMKGRSAQTELEQVRRAWHGDFDLVASRTDGEAAILVADHVWRRGGDGK
ncbi:16S rRNA (guanine(527)-N(7))-methyltransferase RsmG [Sphingomonas sp. HDW15A]|uniref:16S rRNA (guanine(527)-N(7))-methyltransferase RsmG n=1 Tax=Sphingomonas sp. HDW15A TaxID=2714942 RepID=UPI00140D305C|nr:16S rRNA (guanine(527)-N(7))-methyltransferase RsmG [Sphingomonas sp. HDW15A]QIK96960.1 16S rRNA (guanine(527)-N(7))-methyltransferase RsmG [Sphingomonas sp. HDW15A]